MQSAENVLVSRSPLTGRVLDRVAPSAPNEILSAVAAARAAQAAWAALPVRARCRELAKLRGLLLSRAPELSALLHSEQGKSAAEAYTSEILPSADLFAYWARAAPCLLKAKQRRLNPINFPSKRGVLSLRPKGVVALIAPWNYPLAIPLRTIVPALAAGNTVVFKPSEYAPRVGAAVAALFDALPVRNLVTVVHGDGAAGAALLDTDVDHVVFTGSVATGGRVAKACAERLRTCSLELGGKDAAIVLADADLDRAADGIVWGAFANAGQNCASIERVYVVRAVAQAFINKVLERTRALRLGAEHDGEYDVGPMVRPAGLETVRRHVADALQAGATLRCGGDVVGTHYRPTVLTEVTADMPIMTEETFGPVMPIAIVDNTDAAVHEANRSVYGLTTSVWTRDLELGQRLAAKLSSGIVTINNHAFTGAVPSAPWHGTGQSGHGVTNSKFGLYELTSPHYTLIDMAKQKELWWFPHNRALQTIAVNLAVVLGQGGNKLRALWAVLTTFPRRWST